jgi:Flp pilus assembly secretin CpaC
MSMNIKTPSTSAQLKRLRLVALALAVILGITFALGESFLFGNTKSAAPTQEELATARREAEASMPRLPANIEDQLATAQFPQLARYSSSSDPFVDKSGVSVARAGGIPALGGTGLRGSRSGLPPTSVTVPSTPDLNSRVEEWRRNYRTARETNQPIPEKTRIYVLSELTPIGKFTTKGRADVWFRLDAEQRTFSAKVGTRFYDAELIGIGPDGPTFRMSNGTVRTVAWAQKDVIMTTRDKTASETKEQSNEAPTTLPSNDSKTGQSSQVEGGRVSELPATEIPKPQAKTETIESRTQDVIIAQSIPYSAPPTTRIPITATLPLFDENNSGGFTAQSASARMIPAVYRSASNGYNVQYTASSRSSAQFSMDRQFVRYLAHARKPQVIREQAFQTGIVSSSPTPTTTPEPAPSPAPSATPAPQQQSAQQIKSETPVKEKEQVVNPTPTPTVAAAIVAAPDNKTVIAAVAPSVPVAQQANTPRQTNLSPLCDPNYKAELIDTEFTSATTLGNLVDKFNTEFGANIVLDNEVQDIPVRLTITGVPWTQFLRIILDLNDLGQVCMDGRLVGIAKRSKLSQMEDQRKKTEPVVQEIFHLRYLQPTAGGRVNLAGQAQGGPAATIQSLEDAIRAILRASGDPRADVRRVPGRNELLVAGTRDQIEKVRELIRRVDRPGYQVLIKALVYTANENRLRDIGSQFSAVVGNVGQTNLGGFTSLPNSTTGTGTGSGQTGQAGLNPGGIPGLAEGMRQPTNGLAASNAPATFGFTTLIGTAQFSYQLTLAQQKGVVNIQSRPFGIVTDGDTFDLVAGTQIPIVTSSIAGGTSVQTGQVQFIEASRIARITPQVADMEDGTAGFVTLNIQLENNAVDTSLGLFNGVPGVNRQSLQTVLRLRDGETAVIGGLAADTVSNAVSKVPGLGDVPILGNLFKRKTNQENRDRLYFAITVQVIPQDSPLINVPTPSDAVTSPPPPPRAQKPSPFEPRP